MSNEDRIYDKQLTRHLDAKYGDPAPEEECDLVADERAQIMWEEAIDVCDLSKLTRLMNGAKK